ncbi:MAG: DsbE family thiol:disulfide interchange protein [Magnetococcus sp. WYHC-3]
MSGKPEAAEQDLRRQTVAAGVSAVQTARRGGSGLWKWLLMALVVALLGLFFLGLGTDHRWIPSPLVNRPAPALQGEALGGGAPVDLAALRGRWVLVNFWGSWCVSCIQEHPYLVQLARQVRDRRDFVMVGVDFRDTVAGAQAFLRRHGDPGYQHLFDPVQTVAIGWGVYGAPESYLVDPEGVIRLKHTGPLYRGWFEEVALPLIEGKVQP